MFIIKVPSSSANLGSAFDVLGISLVSAPDRFGYADLGHVSALLQLQVTTSPESSAAPFNCEITCGGEGADNISLVPEKNLITQVALYVLRCRGHHAFPSFTKVHIVSGIPMSRGLGSSGAAVIAGVMLGNKIGGFGLSKDRMFDYCLMVEVRWSQTCQLSGY